MQRWRSLKERAIYGGKAQPAAAAHPEPAPTAGACPSAAQRCSGERPAASKRTAKAAPCAGSQVHDIHAAAVAGDRRAVAALALHCPHLIDSADPAGCTPLFLAVTHGQLGTVEELLAAGADADAGEQRSQRRPLHAAATAPCGGERLMRALLHAGACPAARDRHGCTPLHATVAAAVHSWAGGALDCLLCLARHSPALVHAAAADGSTPLHSACRGLSAGGLRVLRALAGAGLLTSHSLSACDASGATPLAAALAAGSLPAVELLLAAGADPSCHGCPRCCRQHNDSTAAAPSVGEEAAGGASWGSLDALRGATARHTCPLGLAASRRSYDILLLLLRAGASAAQLSTHALGRAIVDGLGDVATALVAAGQRCGSAVRPLLAAVERGDAPVLAALLDAGLDPNCHGDAEGAERLLHAALRPGCKHLLAELLPRVGQPQRAQQQQQPRSVSSVRRWLDVARLARRLQCNPASFAVRHSLLAGLQALLASGCPPGAVPAKSGCPPLVAAAGQLDAARCAALLRAGARPDEPSVTGESALDVALFICTDAGLIQLAAEASPGEPPPTGQLQLLQLVELLRGAGATCNRFRAEQCAARSQRGAGRAAGAAAPEPRAEDAEGWGLVHPGLALAAGLVRWSPATHRCWPSSFRRAAAAALLVLHWRGVAPSGVDSAAAAAAAARPSGVRSRRRGAPACHLPPELCHLILSHAATTVSAWVPV